MRGREGTGPPPHGRQSRYSLHGCRCEACTAANTVATRNHRARPDAREKLRATQNRRFDEYAELCAELGVSTQRAWTTHYAALRKAVYPALSANKKLLAGERSPYRRWWLRRYTLTEIQALAAGLTDVL